jgi:murein L,D-transpeptidase YcbB/YkuD
MHPDCLAVLSTARLKRRAALVILTVICSAASGQEAGVAIALRERVERLTTVGSIDIEGAALGREDILPEFYARRAYRPAWTDPARVRELLDLLATAPEHGLAPEDFFLSRLRALTAAAGDAGQQADADLLLTEALIRYGYQRRFGKVNPQEMEPAWNFRRGFAHGADPVDILDAAITAPSLAAFIDARIPAGSWYRRLQQALAHYRGIAASGGWPEVPAGAALRPGERDERVSVLRERLRIEGDLAAGSTPADTEASVFFDDALAAAVRSFQARHGLDVDGVPGAATLAALNVPAPTRVDQIRMSLERLRWLTGDMPDTYVAVNVAGFHVAFVRDNRLVWTGRAVVGRAARQTPICRGAMTYVELNPTWTVPPTILREDVLPKLKSDPGYLQRENMTVLDRNGRAVDPHTVDWNRYRSSVPYTLRQEPGPANALGRIKLMFPNKHAVYLHDTPARALFAKAERTFSSGCIRVEDPLALAELVLDSPQWNRAALEQGIAAGKTRRIDLAKPVPVLLVYLTATTDPDGVTRFFSDVYDRDAALMRALDGPVHLVLPRAETAALQTKRGTASL